MKVVNSSSIGAGGRRRISKQPRAAYEGTERSNVWDSKRSMSEQLREERRLLFGDPPPEPVPEREIVRVVTPLMKEVPKRTQQPLHIKAAAAPGTKHWLTREQVAEALGVSIWLIANWSLNVPLRKIKVGKKYLFDPASIDEVKCTEWYTKHRKRSKYGTVTKEEKRARDYEQATAWRKNNPERYKQVRQKWYQNNKEKIKIYQREYEKRKKLNETNTQKTARSI